MHLLAMTAVLLAAGLEIDARTDCPSGAAVGEQLQSLVGNAGGGAPGERVELSRDGNLLHVRLSDAHGLLAERSLPGSNCAELAGAAAVLVAAWRTEVGSSAPRLQLPGPRRRVELGYEVGAGFSASLAGSAFAAGGTVAASLGPRRGRVLGRLALTGTDLRSIPVGASTQGHARFTRAGLSLGPLVRFRPGRFLLDLYGELTAALVYVDSVGFTSTRSAYDFDVGLGGGGRAAVRAGPLAPFVGVRVVGWLTPQSVLVEGPSGGTAGLPRFEVLLEAGIALGKY